jgi:hypothetical protein
MKTDSASTERPGAASPGETSRAKRTRGAYRQQLTAARRGTGNLSPEARRAAAAILEVLGGVRTPASAAAALGIRLPRYYLWEQRAVEGLIAACQPRPRGRTISADRRLAQLERQLALCQRELARHQALARTAQRALGLTAAVSSSSASTGKGQPASSGARKRRRKPSVRALRAARLLGGADSSGGAAPAAVEVAVEWPGAQGTADGRSRPAAMESIRSPAQADHGGASHAGRPKTVEHR